MPSRRRMKRHRSVEDRPPKPDELQRRVEAAIQNKRFKATCRAILDAQQYMPGGLLLRHSVDIATADRRGQAMGRHIPDEARRMLGAVNHGIGWWITSGLRTVWIEDPETLGVLDQLAEATPEIGIDLTNPMLVVAGPIGDHSATLAEMAQWAMVWGGDGRLFVADLDGDNSDVRPALVEQASAVGVQECFAFPLTMPSGTVLVTAAISVGREVTVFLDARAPGRSSFVASGVAAIAGAALLPCGPGQDPERVVVGGIESTVVKSAPLSRRRDDVIVFERLRVAPASKKSHLAGRSPRAGTRLHEVRGHWRTLRRGTDEERRIWVRSHRRGDGEFGTVVGRVITDARKPTKIRIGGADATP